MTTAASVSGAGAPAGGIGIRGGEVGGVWGADEGGVGGASGVAGDGADGLGAADFGGGGGYVGGFTVGEEGVGVEAGGVQLDGDGDFVGDDEGADNGDCAIVETAKNAMKENRAMLEWAAIERKKIEDQSWVRLREIAFVSETKGELWEEEYMEEREESTYDFWECEPFDGGWTAEIMIID